MAKSLLTLFLTILFLAACTHEDSARRKHEAAPAPADQETRLTGRSSENAAVLARLNPPELLARFKSQVDRTHLNLELRKQTSAERMELYRSLVDAAEFAAASPAADLTRIEILKVFSEIVLDGCGVRLEGCTYVSLFKGNSGAVTLLLALADQPGIDVTKRYRYLSLAFALVGQDDDPRIAMAYVKTAASYEAALRKGGDVRALEQHLEIFDISFAKLRQTLNSERLGDLFSDLENTFDIWNFGRERNSETASREEALFGLVAGRMLQDPKAFPSQIEKLQKNPESAFVKFRKVPLASRKAFGLKDELPANLANFLYDSTWTGRMTIAEANILWQAFLNSMDSSSRLSAERDAREDLLNYARVRLLLSAKSANAVITDFFSTPGKFVTANAFQEGLKESVRAQMIWTDAKKRFEILRSFNDKNLRSAKMEDPVNQAVDGFFGSIDRNIKMLSTYPSMLVMTYHLARLGFSLKIRTWRQTFSIESGQILDWFFDGALDPWMPYSDDDRRLSKSEISMVFYYALEMGVLSEGGVDLETLFKMLTEQMSGPLRLQVERMSDAYRTTYETSPLATEFHRICMVNAQRAKGEPIKISTPMEIVNLTYFATLGVPEGVGSVRFIHPVFQAGWSFFESERVVTSQTLDENLELIRLELTPRIDRLRMLSRLSGDYLVRHESVEREKTLASIDQKILPLEKVRKQFYTQVFNLIKQNGNCGEELIQNELASQLHVIKGLATHFREVHAAMLKHRATSIDALAINKKFGFDGKIDLAEISKHELGLGFNSEMYRVSRLQILLRIKSLLEDGYSDSKTNYPARRTKGSVLLPARLRDIPSSWREEILRLDWNDDAEQFVANGIQQVFDPRTGFINWSSLNSFGLSVQARVRGMTALAKAGTVQTDDGGQRMKPSEIMRMTLAMEKWLEIEGTEWMNVLTITGEFTRLRAASVLDMFAWEEASRTWMGSLDMMFKFLHKDKLGVLEGSPGDKRSERYTRRLGPRADFIKHTEITKTVGEPTLKIPASTMNELTALYRSRVDEQLNLAAEALRDITELEQRKAAAPDKFPSWRFYSSRPAPKVPLLSNSEFEAFRLEVSELVRQTAYGVPEPVNDALKR